MKKTKVVCIGEALIDRIRNKSNQGFTDYLGGAPANVASALRKLKIDSIFIGSLGRDDFGKKIIEQFNELEVNLDFLQSNNDSSTRVDESLFDCKKSKFTSNSLNCSMIFFPKSSLPKLPINIESIFNFLNADATLAGAPPR